MREIEQEERERTKIENEQQAKALEHAIVSGDVAAVEALVEVHSHLMAPGVGNVLSPADLACEYKSVHANVLLLFQFLVYAYAHMLCGRSFGLQLQLHPMCNGISTTRISFKLMNARACVCAGVGH